MTPTFRLGRRCMFWYWLRFLWKRMSDSRFRAEMQTRPWLASGVLLLEQRSVLRQGRDKVALRNLVKG